MSLLSDSQITSELIHLVWGEFSDDLFSQWAQGFCFSEGEPTALIQLSGGPCSIIAVTQAYLLKILLFDLGLQTPISLSEEKIKPLLCRALAIILRRAAGNNNTCLLAVDSSVLPKTQSAVSLAERRPHLISETAQQSTATSCIETPSKDSMANDDNSAANVVGLSVHLETTQCNLPETPERDFCTVPSNGNESPKESPSKRQRVDAQEFHSNLRYEKCRCDSALELRLWQYLPQLCGPHGVILFLYSVVLSKGIGAIKREIEDLDSSLIDHRFGHGNQSLINLLITGQAVPHVWDELYGISSRATIGFLTTLEHFRLCEVGWNLKNPIFPVWVLGSETHLTVLFSDERHLVTKESPYERARRVFRSLDPEGNGFICSSLLADLLQSLDLCHEEEYVQFMASRLDEENLGIILQSSFMEHFFPDEAPPELPERINMHHYNGLVRSSKDGVVKFQSFSLRLPEFVSLSPDGDDSSLKMCLRTKWPSVRLAYSDGVVPSLN